MNEWYDFYFRSALTCKNGDCQCAIPGTTVLEKYVCDGDPDCSDGSDELNCGTY